MSVSLMSVRLIILDYREDFKDEDNTWRYTETGRKCNVSLER